MVSNREFTLSRDTEATSIPAGSPVTIVQGTRAVVTQALGGTVTLRTNQGLFRLEGKDFDALGESVAEELAAGADEAGKAATGAFSEDQVWDALRRCFDPEIPINIVDLGLVYDLRSDGPDAEGRYTVGVRMTLTAQGCGMGPVIAEDARKRIEELPSVCAASVDIVWDPPWNPQMISADGRKQLGLE